MFELVVPLVGVVAVVAVVAVGAWLILRRPRKVDAQDAVGPGHEPVHERAADAVVRRREAERVLADRQQRPQTLTIRPLTETSRQRYLSAWEGVQSRFVERPVLALSEADTIVQQLLGERGLPTEAPGSPAKMLSAEQMQVLDSFRAGRAIEQANTSTHSDTEQVRQGMVHFRSVFEALLEDSAGTPPQGGAPEQSRQPS